MKIRTREMEDTGRTWREVDKSVANEDTWIDKVYGKPCKICGLRKYSPSTSKGAEGGIPSVCKCDEK